MGKIIHGNKNFGYAPITEAGGVYSFGTPVMLSGLVSVTCEIEQEDSNIYADDTTYCVIKGAKVRTAEVNVRYIPSAYAEYLGYKVNDNGSLTDTGSFPNHCIFFETEEEDCETGEATVTLHYLYNVKASMPSIETSTDEESVEASELTINYTAMDSQIAEDDDGVAVQYMEVTRTDANKTGYDGFTTAVILPTTSL